MGELHDAVLHAATREEAITKASTELGAINSGYIPEQKYVRALLENLHKMSEDGDVVIHWDAIRQRS
jgi:pyridoxal/pyridoxine/pyridoxamine kinase